MVIDQKVYLAIEIECFLLTYIFFRLLDASLYDFKECLSVLGFHPFSTIYQWGSDYPLLVESYGSNLFVAALGDEVFEIAEGCSHDGGHIVVIGS